MPCYNAEAYLAEAVASVFNQSYQNVELIVVDDGSSDNSPQILQDLAEHHPRLKRLEQANQGPYPARNLALEKASGELVAFLDADDYWEPTFIEKLYKTMTKARAELAYCGWQNIVEAGENGPPYIPPAYEQDDITAAFLKGCPWPIHAALLKRSLIERVDGFSTRRFSSMDFDFWIRISAVSHNIIRVPEVLAFYRWHDKGQISSIKWRQVLDALQVRLDFIAAHPAQVTHIEPSQLKQLLYGQLIRQAYDAFWKRDLLSAQKLFRAIARYRCFRLKDLKYILIACLPLSALQTLLGNR